MKQNGFWGLLFNALFLTFILAPLVVVLLVAFTDKGFISMPFDGASLRWFRAILDNGDIVPAFWLSARLAFAAAMIGVALAIAVPLAGRAALMSFFLSPMTIPAVVLGIAFLRFSLLYLSGSFRAPVATHVIIAFLSEANARSVPVWLLPDNFKNHSNLVVSLGNVTRWLGHQAEALRAEILPVSRLRKCCTATSPP